jgi:TolB-like protein/DNA-binding winged helix-turn-helix (wHTH) protein
MSSLYRFGEFVLDPRRRSLSYAGSDVSLTPKAFDVLLLLAQNPNRLVTKDELLQGVWGDTFVEEGNLKQYISHLRKALGDNSEDPRLIVTIPRKGYQFAMDVTVADAADRTAQPAVKVSSGEGLLANAETVARRSTKEGISKERTRWRKFAVVGLFATLLVVGFGLWRHFQRAAQPRLRKTILAVLPFENLTGDPSKEYVADGLTEETISQLSMLSPEQLGVIARTSVMGYKHKEERLDQIGRDLSVQYVLENSLRESGDHIRLTAQLIQVKDQTHLWSQDYDYPAKDILNVEDDVAKAVASEIRLRLTSQQQAELAQSHSVNPEAFDAYLQGHYYFERDSDKDTNIAVKYFERATELDPSYALAWVGLSRARNWQAVSGLVPAETGHQAAREAVERALTLNPNLALAYEQMARIQRQVDFDWVGADVSIHRAIALEPGNPQIVRSAASQASILGRLDESVQLAHQAVDLDPLNAASWVELGEAEYFAGNLDKAETDYKKAQELRPDSYLAATFLTYIDVMEGRPQDASAQIKRVGPEYIRIFLNAITYHALARETESDAALRELIEKYQAIDPYLIAQVYAFRNQPDEVFKWLNRAYAERNDGLIYMKPDPVLKSLHGDPRFAALLKKLNLPN